MMAMGAASPLILVVDDDFVDLTVARRALEKAGYRVECAEDGLNVVQAVKNFEPDLVLMDVNMPGLRGDHAARVLPMMAYNRGGDPVPVVLRSGLPDSKLKELCENISAAGYVSKDVDDEGLLAVVRKFAPQSDAAQTG